MTDGRRDADLEASARARILDEYRRNADLRREQGVTLGRPRGVLTEEAAAERRKLLEEEKAASAAWESNRALPDKEPQTEAEKEEFKRVWNESVCQKERELTHAHGDAMQRLQSELTKYPEIEQEFDWRRVPRR